MATAGRDRTVAFVHLLYCEILLLLLIDLLLLVLLLHRFDLGTGIDRHRSLLFNKNKH